MPLIEKANVLCNCVLRMFSIHKHGTAVCVGFTVEPSKMYPDYDVVHLCLLKDAVDDGSKKLPDKCSPVHMVSATPEEAKTIASKLILAAELWEYNVKRMPKEKAKA